MKMKIIVLAALLLAACATSDQPIARQSYPSYAEYSAAHNEAPEMTRDGHSEAQQACFMHVLLDHLPDSITTKLNDFATGRTVLTQSEYADLQKESARYAGDLNFIRPFKPELDRCLV